MKHTTRAFCGAAKPVLFAGALTLVGVADLSAQVGAAPAKKGFVGVSVGAQPRRQDLTVSSSLSVYGETATFDTSQHIGNGPFVDVMGGYRVVQNLYVAVGYSTFSKKSDATVTARIPSPLVFDQFRTTSATVGDLEHKENNVYLQGMWFVPVSEKVDVAIYGGAAFINVKQGYFSAFGVAPASQNLTYNLDTQSASSTGGTVGVDITYLFHRSVGVAVFGRYVGGSVNFPNLGDVKAGGVHAGLGLRYRF